MIIIQTLDKSIKLAKLFHFLIFSLATMTVFSQHLSIVSQPLNHMWYHLHPVILVTCFEISFELLSATHPHSKHSILNAIAYDGSFCTMSKLFYVEEISNQCRNYLFIYKYRCPSTYINKEFGHFFDQYNQFESFSSILPMLNEESSFVTIHNDLVPSPTPEPSQVALAIALSQTNQNEAGDETNLQQVLPPNQDQEKRPHVRNSSKCQ